jgi:coenzyme F420-reducing hydrogenase delta subunit/ferredoxin
MCSGRVDPAHILSAFSKGLDGVFIGGCRLNECNYITHGNYYAQNMVLLVKRIMEHMGLNPARLRLEFMSGSEGNVFVEVVNDFVREIKELGPLGVSEELDEAGFKSKIAEVKKLVPYIKIMKNTKLRTPLHEPAEHETYFTKEEIGELLDKAVSYYIDPGKCQACTTCAGRCPVEAVKSEKGQVHIIDQEICIKCGTCLAACPPQFAAIIKITGEPVPPPPPEGQRDIIRKSKEVSA